MPTKPTGDIEMTELGNGSESPTTQYSRLEGADDAADSALALLPGRATAALRSLVAHVLAVALLVCALIIRPWANAPIYVVLCAAALLFPNFWKAVDITLIPELKTRDLHYSCVPAPSPRLANACALVALLSVAVRIAAQFVSSAQEWCDQHPVGCRDLGFDRFIAPMDTSRFTVVLLPDILVFFGALGVARLVGKATNWQAKEIHRINPPIGLLLFIAATVAVISRASVSMVPVLVLACAHLVPWGMGWSLSPGVERALVFFGAFWGFVVLFGNSITNHTGVVEWVRSHPEAHLKLFDVGGLSVDDFNASFALHLVAVLVFALLCCTFLHVRAPNEDQKRSASFRKQAVAAGAVNRESFLFRLREHRTVLWLRAHSPMLLLVLFPVVAFQAPCFPSAVWLVVYLLGMILSVERYNKLLPFMLVYIWICFSITYAADLIHNEFATNTFGEFVGFRQLTRDVLTTTEVLQVSLAIAIAATMQVSRDTTIASSSLSSHVNQLQRKKVKIRGEVFGEAAGSSDALTEQGSSSPEPREPSQPNGPSEEPKVPGLVRLKEAVLHRLEKAKTMVILLLLQNSAILSLALVFGLAVFDGATVIGLVFLLLFALFMLANKFVLESFWPLIPMYTFLVLLLQYTFICLPMETSEAHYVVGLRIRRAPTGWMLVPAAVLLLVSIIQLNLFQLERGFTPPPVSSFIINFRSNLSRFLCMGVFFGIAMLLPPSCITLLYLLLALTMTISTVMYPFANTIYVIASVVAWVTMLLQYAMLYRPLHDGFDETVGGSIGLQANTAGFMIAASDPLLNFMPWVAALVTAYCTAKYLPDAREAAQRSAMRYHRHVANTPQAFDFAPATDYDEDAEAQAEYRIFLEEDDEAAAKDKRFKPRAAVSRLGTVMDPGYIERMLRSFTKIGKRLIVLHNPKVTLLVLFLAAISSKSVYTFPGATEPLRMHSNLLSTMYLLIVAILNSTQNWSPTTMLATCVYSAAVQLLIFLYQFDVLRGPASNADPRLLAYVGLVRVGESVSFYQLLSPHVVVFIFSLLQTKTALWRIRINKKGSFRVAPYAALKDFLPHKPTRTTTLLRRVRYHVLLKSLRTVDFMVDSFFRCYGDDITLLVFLLCAGIEPNTLWALVIVVSTGYTAFFSDKDKMFSGFRLTILHLMLTLCLLAQYALYLGLPPDYINSMPCYPNMAEAKVFWGGFFNYFIVIPEASHLWQTFFMCMTVGMYRNAKADLDNPCRKTRRFGFSALYQTVLKELERIRTEQAPLSDLQAALPPPVEGDLAYKPARPAGAPVQRLQTGPVSLPDATTSAEPVCRNFMFVRRKKPEDLWNIWRFTYAPLATLLLVFLVGASSQPFTLITLFFVIGPLVCFHKAAELWWLGWTFWRKLVLALWAVMVIQVFCQFPPLHTALTAVRQLKYLGLWEVASPAARAVVLGIVYMQLYVFDDPRMAYVLYSLHQEQLQSQLRARSYLKRRHEKLNAFLLEQHKKMAERRARLNIVRQDRERKKTAGSDRRQSKSNEPEADAPLASAPQSVATVQERMRTLATRFLVQLGIAPAEEEKKTRTGPSAVEQQLLVIADALLERSLVRDLPGEVVKNQAPVLHFLNALRQFVSSFTDWLCYLVFVFTFIYNSSMLDMALPLSVFAFAMLVTTPPRAYWHYCTLFLEFLIVIKCLVKVFSIELQVFDSFVLVNDLVDHVDTGFFGALAADIVTLICVLLHRSVARKNGLWYYTEFSHQLAAQYAAETEAALSAQKKEIELKKIEQEKEEEGEGPAEDKKPTSSGENAVLPPDPIVPGATNLPNEATNGSVPPTETDQSKGAVVSSGVTVPKVRLDGVIEKERDSDSTPPSDHTSEHTGGDSEPEESENEEDSEPDTEVEQPLPVLPQLPRGWGILRDRMQHGTLVPEDDEAHITISEESGPSRAVPPEKPAEQASTSVVEKVRHFVLSRVNKERMGTDLSLASFCIDLVAFFVWLFSFSAIAGGGADFVKSLQNNLLPGGMVLTLLGLFLSMVVDRVAYIKKWLPLKLSLHYISVVLYFVLAYIIFVANDTGAWQGRFFLWLKAIWLAISALQVLHGYPRVWTPGVLTATYRPFTHKLYLGFRALPFVFEMKSLLEWSFTKTTLQLGDWMKLEDIHHELLLVRAAREQDKELEKKRIEGGAFPFRAKFFSGCLLFAALLFLLFFPLLYYSSFSPALAPNECNATVVDIRFSQSAPLFQGESRVTESNPKPAAADAQRLGELLAGTRPFIQQEENVDTTSDEVYVQPMGLQTESLGAWGISSAARRRLIASLNASEPVEIEVSASVTRARGQGGPTFLVPQTYTVPDSLRLQLADLLSSDSSGQIYFPEFYSPFLLNAPLEITVIAQGKPTGKQDCIFTIYRPYPDPPYWEVMCRGLFRNGNGLSPLTKAEGACLATGGLDCDPSVEYSTAAQNRNNGWVPMYFVLISMQVPKEGGLSGLFQSFSIIAIYTTFVLTIASVVRGSLVGSAMRIILDDMKNPQPLLSLVEDIKLARSEGELWLEAELYLELIHIFQSPDLLKQWTDA